MAHSEREVKVDLNNRGIAKLTERLENVNRLLKQIGAMIVRDARQAFNAQEFGDFVWPQKYPNQKGDPNFISIAGVVQDFSEGETKPRPETFEPRPAGFRTGALQNSVASKVIDDAVEVGSAVPYATLFQTGGISEQEVTADIKDAIIDWLDKTTTRTVTEVVGWETGSAEHPLRMDKAVRKVRDKRVTSPNEKYRKKLNFLLYPDVTILETEMNQRPYIGITSRRSEIFQEMMSDFMAGDIDG